MMAKLVVHGMPAPLQLSRDASVAVARKLFLDVTDQFDQAFVREILDRMSADSRRCFAAVRSLGILLGWNSLWAADDRRAGVVAHEAKGAAFF